MTEINYTMRQLPEDAEVDLPDINGWIMMSPEEFNRLKALDENVKREINTLKEYRCDLLSSAGSIAAHNILDSKIELLESLYKINQE